MTGKIIGEAFADRPQLLQSVQALASGNAIVNGILEDVATYVKELQSDLKAAELRAKQAETQKKGAEENARAAATKLLSVQDDREAKRRKLNGPDSSLVLGSPKIDNGGGGSDFMTASWQIPTLDVSFVVPQRKKYSLQISPDRSQGIRALNTVSKIADFGLSWTAVEHVLRLPVPEKTTASHNYCIFPKGGDGLSGDGANDNGLETLVWSTSNTTKKGDEEKPTESEQVKQALESASAQVVEPTEDEFVSTYKNPMRRNEKQYHVKAFKGSKEGYLFFLPTGIAFVFKKPLLFFAFSAIHSISYTSVLQRTFNLNISATPSTSKDGETVETEFSMLDQGDFPAIDDYVKRHGLNDASMAEARKAKKYNVNKDQPGDMADRDTELQKAELEAAGIALEDEDDEDDDENFDPGSEGESEGEGSSSDEDDDPGHQDAMDEDLVKDELGSEAEEVEAEE